MTRNTKKLHADKKMPFSAVALARFWFFSPRLLLSMALTPTPVPTPTAIIIFCREKAKDTAVRASSLTQDTNTESTTLYSACTSIEIIMGTLSFTSRGLISMVPIMFSRSMTGEVWGRLFSTFSPFEHLKLGSLWQGCRSAAKLPLPETWAGHRSTLPTFYRCLCRKARAASQPRVFSLAAAASRIILTQVSRPRAALMARS